MESVKKGTSAAGVLAQLQSTAKGVNAPNSIKGGTAATNFTVTPSGSTPVGGYVPKKSEITRSTAYRVEPKVSVGGSTNDHAK